MARAGLQVIDSSMISFLIAVRNEERHIGETLECLANQTTADDIEVLIFDAESSDHTIKIAQEYAPHFKHFQIHPNPELSASSAWNKGVELARFDRVALLSGHVLLPSTYCEIALKNLSEKVAGVGFRVIGVESDPSSATIAAACNSVLVTGGSAYTSPETSKAVDTIAYGTYWKDRLRSVGGFDEGIERGQDWDINLRLTQQGHKLMLLAGDPVQYFVRSSLPQIYQRFWLAGLWKPRIQLKNRSLPKLRHLAPATAIIVAFALMLSLAFLESERLLPCAFAISTLYVGAILASYFQRKPRPHLPTYLAAVIGIHFFYGTGALVGLAFMKRPSS